jgi:hypothetical protein
MPSSSRWMFLAVVVCGCGTESAGSPRAPENVVAAPGDARLVFAGRQGTAPLGQTIALRLREDAPTPKVKVGYADGSGWLSAGIAGSGARRLLSVQPVSHRLGPGTYRATIDVEGSGKAVSPERLEVTLVVQGYTLSTCPPGSTLRYAGGGNGGREPADFGRAFFGRYCTGCHGSAVIGAARSGAPPGVNWDTPESIRAQRHWIDAFAGRGPGASNEDMPPEWVPVQPTSAERQLLARWIACGAP